MGQTSGSVVMHRFESRVLDPISGFGGLEYLGYLGSDVHIHIHKDIYIYRVQLVTQCKLRTSI